MKLDVPKFPDNVCFCAAVEFVPAAAWNAARLNRKQFCDALDKLMRARLGEKLSREWNLDKQAHHGPLRETDQGLGVTFVLRAWRWAPTETRTCDATCVECVATGEEPAT